MAQYIDKSALVKWAEETYLCENASMVRKVCFKQLLEYLDIIDTIETKDVDLEREQRMKECPYRQVVCTMYEDKILECKGACSWVVDYPELKELQAQKGE